MFFGLLGTGKKETTSQELSTLNEIVNETVTTFLQSTSNEVDDETNALNKLKARNIEFLAGCKNSGIEQSINITKVTEIQNNNQTHSDIASAVAAEISTEAVNSKEKTNDIFGDMYETVQGMLGTNTTETKIKTEIENKVKSAIETNLTQETLNEIVQKYKIDNIQNLESIKFDPCGIDSITNALLSVYDDVDAVGAVGAVALELSNNCPNDADCIISQNILLEQTAKAITENIIGSLISANLEVDSDIDATQENVDESDTVGTITDFLGSYWWVFVIIGLLIVAAIGLSLYFSSSGGSSAPAPAPAPAASIPVGIADPSTAIAAQLAKSFRQPPPTV